MNNLKLSIIVPVYNVEKYIEKCISSLLVENLNGYEIIVVNDGTKDRSVEIIREKFVDSRISIIEQNNGGLSSARNYGISKSKGEYIWCVDSDDWIETDEIPKMIALLDGQIDVLYFSSYYNDYDGTGETGVTVLDNMANTGRGLACTSFAHCAPYYVMRKGMLDENNLRFTEGILHEDSLFTPIMITHCSKVRRYDSPVYHHFQRAGSITHTVSPKHIYDMMYVVKTLVEYGEELSQDIRWKWGRCIAQITDGMLLCSKHCKDKKTKADLKNFVNHNSVLIEYLSHSGRNNRLMARFASLMGGRLYQAYSILYKIRY